MATSLEIHQLGTNVGLAFDTEIERLSNTEVKEVIEFTYSFICEVQLDTVFTPENLPRLTTLLDGSNGVNITTFFRSYISKFYCFNSNDAINSKGVLINYITQITSLESFTGDAIKDRDLVILPSTLEKVLQNKEDITSLLLVNTWLIPIILLVLFGIRHSTYLNNTLKSIQAQI